MRIFKADTGKDVSEPRSDLHKALDTMESILEFWVNSSLTSHRALPVWHHLTEADLL